MALSHDIAAFTNLLGVQNAHIVFPFAVNDWQTKEDRDAFINELLILNDNQKIG
jgi:hypothetical protein